MKGKINLVENFKNSINRSKSWLSEKTHKIDKPITRVLKKKRKKTQRN